MKIALTGSSGIVGSFIYSQLQKDGHEILLIKSNIAKKEPRSFSYDEFCSHEDESIDYVVHCGAQTYKNRPDTDGNSFLESNLIRTSELGDWALRNNLKGFIFVSSVHVADYLSSFTNQNFKDKFSPELQKYFLSKWFAELYLQHLLQGTNTKLSILRIGSPIKSDYCDSSLVRALVQACLEGKVIELTVSDEEALNLTWLEDLIATVRNLIENNASSTEEILSFSASVSSTIRMIERCVGNSLSISRLDKTSTPRFSVRGGKFSGEVPTPLTEPKHFLSQYISNLKATK